MKISTFIKAKQLFSDYPLTVTIKLALSILLTVLSFLIPGRYYLISFCGGKIYLNLKESFMIRNRALGIYEFWKTRLFFDIVREGMTIIDAGVNKGYYSLLFAKLMNDKGQILSFEPDIGNCFWFNKSIQANKYKSIKLYQCALSESDSEAIFYPGKKSGWGSLRSSHETDLQKKTMVVKTKKLDTILQEEGISRVDIIKIDVQGADLLMLKGARKFLEANPKLKIAMDVDVKGEEERQQLFDLLTSYGFKISKIGKKLEPIERIDETIKEIYAEKIS